MLFNPEWSNPTIEAAPYRLDPLIAWLESQPAHEQYNFDDCSGSCLFAQFFRSEGISDWLTAYWAVPIRIRCEIAIPKPNTFGAALTRARSIAAGGERRDALSNHSNALVKP